MPPAAPPRRGARISKPRGGHDVFGLVAKRSPVECHVTGSTFLRRWQRPAALASAEAHNRAGVTRFDPFIKCTGQKHSWPPASLPGGAPVQRTGGPGYELTSRARINGAACRAVGKRAAGDVSLTQPGPISCCTTDELAGVLNDQ